MNDSIPETIQIEDPELIADIDLLHNKTAAYDTLLHSLIDEMAGRAALLEEAKKDLWKKIDAVCGINSSGETYALNLRTKTLTRRTERGEKQGGQ